jgi:hypothetical protein
MNNATKITIGTIVLSALLVGVLVANLALA